MHQIIRLWLLIVVPLLVGSAAAAMTVEVPLTAREVQVSGLDDEAQFLITVDASKDRESAPLLVLNWSASDLVDPKQSTIAIAVDGEIQRSVWLEDLNENEYTVPLIGLTGGKHLVSVKASLQVSGDDRCLQRHRDNAWFTIEPESRVVWNRGLSAPRKSVLKEYPAQWSRLANGPTGITLQLDTDLDKAAMGAFLDANHLLRQWAYEPQLVPTETTVGTLRLQTVDRLPSASRAVKRLNQLPDARFVLMVDEPGTIVAVGRDTRGLREAVLMLGNDRARALCLSALCTAGEQSPRPAKDAAKRMSRDPAQVWQLGDSGQANGWTARGEGQHQMRFVWQKPATWQVQDWPVLQLHARATRSKAIDPEHSAVTIRINNRPLATYSLASWQDSRNAQIRIPRELWEAPQWVFDVLVYQKPVDEKVCSASDQRGMWFTVSPETELIVPHKETAYEGVASFHADSADVTALPLYIDASQDDRLTLERVFASAGALYPFVSARDAMPKSDSPQKVWELVDASQCQSLRCIQVLKEAPAASPLQYTPTLWKDTSGELQIPHIKTIGTLALHYREKTTDQPEQLIVVPGPIADASVEPPDYKGLVGHIALFADSWHILDIREPTGDALTVTGAATAVANPRVTANTSQEQSQLRWLNFVWAALSLLTILGVSIRLWRNPKDKATDKNWELHDD